VLWWKKLEKYSDRVYDYFRSIIISVVVARWDCEIFMREFKNFHKMEFLYFYS
jgi:hypothetical protein